MSLDEFRAWLEGFEASFTGPPSEEQWAAVKTKLATVRMIKVGGIPSLSPPTTWAVGPSYAPPGSTPSFPARTPTTCVAEYPAGPDPSVGG